MIVSGAKSLLANGTAIIPFLLSLYILAIGAGKSTLVRRKDIKIDDSKLCSNLMCPHYFSTK
jgi:hypothetical protein